MNCSQIAKEVRRNILKMHFLSKESHIGSALSCADILAVLYFSALNINPKKPLDENRDRFILSKGHAVSALYAVLAERGFFSKKLLDTFCQDGSALPGHSTKNTAPGVEVSTGSLGHGLPMGVGMALAAKKDKKKWRVFVLMSDGECDEGTTWESALFAAHHKLDNLTVIIDRNRFQALGRTSEVLNTEPLKDKWLTFGWQFREIKGHNFDETEKAFSEVPFEKNKPSVIIADTIKGSGGKTNCKIFEDKLEWHYKSPDKDTYENAIKLLNKE